MLRIYFSLPLVLVLSACATSPSAPSELQRGTYVSPAPPPRPGVGAPVVGQPEPFEPRNYPKSPYTRVLPQDENTRRGPGLWSVEAPQASSSRDEDQNNPITWRGYFFPQDLDMRETIEGQKCYREIFQTAQAAVDAVNNNSLSSLLRTLPEDERMCFVVKAYRHCVTEKHKINEAKRGKAFSENLGETPFSLRDLRRTADLLEKARCIKDLPMEAERILRVLKPQIDRLLHSDNGPKN